VAKHSGYQQEVFTTFILPLIASAVMGAICFGINKLFGLIPGNSYGINLLSVVVCMIVSVVVYFAILFVTKGLTHEDMLNFPMGLRIERIAKKFRLMK
jgi:stage V sporulation protein B